MKKNWKKWRRGKLERKDKMGWLILWDLWDSSPSAIYNTW